VDSAVSAMASDTPRQVLAEASGIHIGCRREDSCKEGRGGYRRMSRVESRMVGSGECVVVGGVER
jgi:hypothetical protein